MLDSHPVPVMSSYEPTSPIFLTSKFNLLNIKLTTHLTFRFKTTMALQPASKSLLLLGSCVPCLKQGASKFKIKRLELDTYLNMYFSKFEYVYAHDPNKLCKTGDLVLIERLPEKLTRLITHQVKKVVYPLGDVTDPLTGKKTVVGQFREEIYAENKVYGEKESTFKYEKAPERGWQEYKKDFSHLDIYVKYHEDGSKDPSAV